MYEACLECPEGLGVLEKIPSAGEVFIFSGTTNYTIKKQILLALPMRAFQYLNATK